MERCSAEGRCLSVVGPLDEYPLHQAPLPVAWAGSSDRNFYDRCYFNAHDRTGDIFLITGVGYYPNLGTKDAFVLRAPRRRRRPPCTSPTRSTTTGSTSTSATTASRWSSRCSKLRVVLEETEGIALRPDLGGLLRRASRSSRTSCAPAAGSPSTPSASRRSAPGAARSSIDGEDIAVTPDPGSAPATAPGASARSARRSRPGAPLDPPFEGMWWLYVPMRFDDYAIVLIIQEDPDGYRTLNDCHPRSGTTAGSSSSAGRGSTIHYTSGTRMPDRRDDHLHDAGRQAAAARGRVEARRTDPRRWRLRRRPRLDPRPVEGPGLHRAGHLRPERPGRRRPRHVRRHRPRRPRRLPKATAPRAGASSSTAPSAATTPAASPTGSPSPLTDHRRQHMTLTTATPSSSTATGPPPPPATSSEVVSPHTEEVVATVPEGTAADIDAAVAAARRAFDEGPWPRMTPAGAHRRRPGLLGPVRRQARRDGRRDHRRDGLADVVLQPRAVAGAVDADRGVPRHRPRRTRGRRAPGRARRARHRAPRAGRCRRRDPAVERAAVHDHVQGGPGAAGRLHRRGEARAGDPARRAT